MNSRCPSPGTCARLAVPLLLLCSAACSEDVGDLDCGSDCNSPCGQFCINYAQCFLSEAEALALNSHGAAECAIADRAAVLSSCVADCEAETSPACAGCLVNSTPACGGTICPDECPRDALRSIRTDIAQAAVCAAANPETAPTCQDASVEGASASLEEEFFMSVGPYEGTAQIIELNPLRVVLSTGSTLAISLPTEVPLPPAGTTLDVDLTLTCGLGCGYEVSVTWAGGFFGVWNTDPTNFSSIGPVALDFAPGSCAAPSNQCVTVQSLDLVLEGGTKLSAGERVQMGDYEIVLISAVDFLAPDFFCTDIPGGASTGYTYQR